MNQDLHEHALTIEEEATTLTEIAALVTVIMDKVEDFQEESCAVKYEYERTIDPLYSILMRLLSDSIEHLNAESAQLQALARSK